MRLTSFTTLLLFVTILFFAPPLTLGAEDSGWMEIDLPEDVMSLHQGLFLLPLTTGGVALCIEGHDGSLRCFEETGEELHHWPVQDGRGRSGIVSGSMPYRYWISNARLTVTSLSSESTADWSISDEDFLFHSDVSFPYSGKFMAYESRYHCTFRILDVNTGTLAWEVNSNRETLDCLMEHLLIEPSGEFLVLVDQASPEEEVCSLILRGAPNTIYQRRLPGRHTRMALSNDSSSLIRLSALHAEESGEVEIQVLTVPELELREFSRITVDGGCDFAVSPTDDLIAVATGSKLLLYGSDPLRRVTEFLIPTGSVKYVRFGPDGKSIYVTTKSSKILRRTVESSITFTDVPEPTIRTAPPVFNRLPEDMDDIQRVILYSKAFNELRWKVVSTITKRGSVYERNVPEASRIDKRRLKTPGQTLFSFPHGMKYYFEVVISGGKLSSTALPYPASGVYWTKDLSMPLLPQDASLPRYGSTLAIQSRGEDAILTLDLTTGEESWRMSTLDQPFGAANEAILLSEDNSFIILSDNVDEERTRLTRLSRDRSDPIPQITLEGHTSRILLTRDDSTLARFVLRPGSVSAHHRLEILRTSDLEVLDTLLLDGAAIEDAMFTADQDSIVFLTGPELRFYKLHPFRSQGIVPMPEGNGVAFDLDTEGGMIYVGTRTKNLYRIDILGYE